MNNFTSSNEKSNSDIQLALDPNLISLPLHVSAASPLGIASNDNVIEQSSQPNNAKTEEVQQQSDLTKDANSQSLVKNPYEIYSQMQLNELIPLILLQKGPGFKFADLSEDAILQDIEKEQNNETSNTDVVNPERPSVNSISIGVETDDAMDIDYPNKELNIQGSEVTSGEHSDTTTENFVSFNDNDEDFTTQEQFLKIRKEMIEHINLAMNESSLALEFLSLLLSSVKESTALTSMSPYLKKTVPVCSLNSDKIPHKSVSKEDQIRTEVLNRGWKLRSLNESRSILKTNYEQLESVLSKEHMYWSKISKYVNNKDVIFKMRDKSTGLRSLGIKYGYEDSGSTYKRDRGVAVLRNNPEQNLLELIPSIVIDNPMSKSSEKFIRLRILTKIDSEDDYILTGESPLDSLFLNGTTQENDQDDIRNQISKLKTFVFEQELMYQAKKECSLLISYGVTIENENKIVMELPNEKIEMELLPIDDSSVINHIQDAPRANDKRATLALATLRMLLVVMYKKNLKRRLTSDHSTTLNIENDILLIRPLLGKIRHQNYKILLRKIIKSYVLDVVESSKLIETSIQDEQKVEMLEDANIQKLAREISAFDQLLNTSKTKFEITMDKTADFHLILSSPNYCNAVVSVHYKDLECDVSFETEFSEFKEIEEFLNFLVIEYIKNKEDVIKSE